MIICRAGEDCVQSLKCMHVRAAPGRRALVRSGHHSAYYNNKYFDFSCLHCRRRHKFNLARSGPNFLPATITNKLFPLGARAGVRSVRMPNYFSFMCCAGQRRLAVATAPARAPAGIYAFPCGVHAPRSMKQYAITYHYINMFVRKLSSYSRMRERA